MTPNQLQSILICDDSAEEVRVLVALLRSANYKLSIASNGKEACDRASVLKPDLILMDVRMPMMNGFAACRILKAHADTRDIPVIFLTAANELCDRLEGLSLGAVDYIVKPASEAEVLLRVGIHLQQNKPDYQVPVEAHDHDTAAIVEACIRLLEADLSTSPCIEELSQKLGTHRHNLSNAFKEVFGSTVYAWLRERRMKQACVWLTDSKMSINGIADELGFSTSGNFATAFRERYGVTPREYRKAMQRDAQRPPAYMWRLSH